METLSLSRESASAFIRRTASQLRSFSQRVSQDLSGWSASGPDKVRDAVFRIAYVARRTAIQWCLAVANYLQKMQAHAIARAASVKGPARHAGITIPPPTFPNPDRWYSPRPRVPHTLYMRPPESNVTIREVNYDDFDNAPTEVYHPIPTSELDRDHGPDSDAPDFDDIPTDVYHPIPTKEHGRSSHPYPG